MIRGFRVAEKVEFAGVRGAREGGSAGRKTP